MRIRQLGIRSNFDVADTLFFISHINLFCDRCEDYR